MTLNDVLALTQAGFTKDEIVRMAGGAMPAPTPEQKPAPEPEAKPLDMAAEFAALRESIIDGIRSANLAVTQQPEQVSADDVLASIINPPVK